MSATDETIHIFRQIKRGKISKHLRLFELIIKIKERKGT